MKTETITYQIVVRSTFDAQENETVYQTYEADELTAALKELDRVRAEIEPYYRAKYRLERVIETVQTMLIAGESQ